MSNTLANQEKSTFVIIGGTSGIGKALAMQLRNEENTVHIASRHTGLDIRDEKSICAYFESIGAFDHLVITAGSYAPGGKVKGWQGVTSAAKEQGAAIFCQLWHVGRVSHPTFQKGELPIRWVCV